MSDIYISDSVLRNLLDSPVESFDIEFKRELDLSDSNDKEKLAKEIAALCNYGGGWIVLGRNDNGSYPDNCPPALDIVTPDLVNQIASAYLEPAPQCVVRNMQPEAVDYEVIIICVPSHDKVPVCLKKGSRKGTYYIRKTGPKSEAIAAPHEWQEIIRRCVQADSDALVAQIQTIVTRPVVVQEQPSDDLDQDVAFMIEEWKKYVAEIDYSPVDLRENFVVYGCELIDAQTVNTLELNQAVERMPMGIYDEYPHFFRASPNLPSVLDNEAGVPGVHTESSAYDNDVFSTSRVSEKGCVVAITSYFEDSHLLKGFVERQSLGQWERGQNFWVGDHMRCINAYLSAIHHWSKTFGFQGNARIQISYHGLQGRILKEPSPRRRYRSPQKVRQNRKHIEDVCDVSSFGGNATRAAVIARMFQPVYNLLLGSSARKLTAKDVLHYIKNP